MVRRLIHNYNSLLGVQRPIQELLFNQDFISDPITRIPYYPFKFPLLVRDCTQNRAASPLALPVWRQPQLKGLINTHPHFDVLTPWGKWAFIKVDEFISLVQQDHQSVAEVHLEPIHLFPCVSVCDVVWRRHVSAAIAPVPPFERHIRYWLLRTIHVSQLHSD